ncbi:hypothetical protein CCNA_03967 [Caulobacter vibrioides NA1000]|uniref:Uncharacterized protein n=1 Tax=Caulobacter vibrioides (strain NA1000 / CB15N) TaxID=565050 RepID=A0A0H3J1Q4_CAUVN|nr:hypothetical protein [Caulobacter vibrioides]YP_009020539.1 hypothetical protein CCNA_03967 [Caulobacter vibrioides NA1000]AHI88570.1 hypothetical protein CCNA_03967 [Caulobacter vibrioides NA1000]
MIFRTDKQLRRWMGVFAAMLVGLLVIQAPVAAADRMLHAIGQSHAANPFAGALLDQHEHDVCHGQDCHGQDEEHGTGHTSVPSYGTADSDANSNADSEVAGPHHHHHHDNHTAYGLTMSPSLPVRWASARSLFGAEDDLRPGLAPQLRDRPPKAHLAHVA